MKKPGNKIILGSANKEIQDVLKNTYPDRQMYTIHFNQNEEFFLKLPEPFTVSPFPVHHDISVSLPEKKYSTMLKDVLTQILPLIPSVFNRTSYFFDPTEIFHPSF